MEVERAKSLKPDSCTARFDVNQEDVVLTIQCNSYKNSDSCKKQIDVYGDLSAALPSGGSTAMSVFLPVQHNWTLGNFRVTFYDEVRLGRVGKNTVLNGLREMQDKGDPVMIIEIQEQDKYCINPTTVAVIPTKASLLLKAVEKGGTDIMTTGDITHALKYRRAEATLTYSVFRLCLCLMLALTAVWGLYLKPTQVLDTTPCFPFFDGNYSAPSIDSVLPIHPKTQLEAFDLGALSCQLKHSPADAASILEVASHGCNPCISSFNSMFYLTSIVGTLTALLVVKFRPPHN